MFTFLPSQAELPAMTALQEVEQLLLKLTRAKKALLVQQPVSDWGAVTNAVQIAELLAKHKA